MSKERTLNRRVILGAILLTGCIVILFAWLHASEKSQPIKEAVNLYQTDVAGSDVKKWNPQLLLFSPYELAKAPLAEVFEYPVGTEYGAFAYDAQGYGEENEKRGGKHSGADLNGIGGENTDLGWPVYASGRGLLVYAGKPSDDWGNVVVLLHRLPNGDYVQTIYAHLDKIEDFALGSLVARGEKIGSIGNAEGRYWAHLHFEVAQSIGLEAGKPAYSKSTFNRIDPQVFLADYAPTGHFLMADPLLGLRKHQQISDMRESIQFVSDIPDAEQTKPSQEQKKP